MSSVALGMGAEYGEAPPQRAGQVAASAPSVDAAIEQQGHVTLSRIDDSTFESTVEQTFEFGLELLLDGIERRYGQPA